MPSTSRAEVSAPDVGDATMAHHHQQQQQQSRSKHHNVVETHLVVLKSGNNRNNNNIVSAFGREEKIDDDNYDNEDEKDENVEGDENENEDSQRPLVVEIQFTSQTTYDEADDGYDYGGLLEVDDDDNDILLAPLGKEEEKDHHRLSSSASVSSIDEEQFMNRACSPVEEAEALRNKSLALFSNAGDWLSSSFDDDGEPKSPFSFFVKKTSSCGDDNNNNNDEDSVSSTNSNYFDPRDLNPTDWLKAMDATTLGFAVVALATVVTHPLLFIAGALTAFGTAHAAGAGYDYYSWWFTPTTTSPVSDAAGATETNSCTATDATTTTTTICCGVEAEDSLGNTLRLDQSSGRQPPQEAGTAEQAGEQPSPPIAAPAHPPSGTGDLDGELVSDDHINNAWLNRQYPQLEYQLLNAEEEEPFVGLSAIEFFHIFLDDHAPYNFVEFQKKRGDVDVDYGSWKDLLQKNENRTDTTELSSQEELLSLHPSAATSIQDLQQQSIHSLQQRVISFKAKTNSFFGPPYASTTKTQRILIGSKKWAVLESKTLLSDIPFCDRFIVMERWVIEAEKHHDDHIYTCSVSSSCQVIFTKSCPFEYQIRTKSETALKDVGVAWSAMAQQALKLAEKNRVMRQQSLQRNVLAENEEEIEQRRPITESGPHSSDTISSKIVPPRSSLDESIEVEHDGDLGVIRLRRSDSEPKLVSRQDVPHKSLQPQMPQQHVGRILRRSLSQIGRRTRTFSNTSFGSFKQQQQQQQAHNSNIQGVSTSPATIAVDVCS